MVGKTFLGRAAKAALEYRVRNGVRLDEPCDIYELIHRAEVELRFMEVKSLAGLYLVNGTVGQINVCAFRPSGFQHFTAAHELGHHVFGHGSTIDSELDYKESLSSRGSEERLADMFARFLLMPQRAVYTGFKRIGANLTDLTAQQVFRVSAWLGVGYTSLVHQMRWSLEMIDNVQFETLLKHRTKLPAIKSSLAPCISTFGRCELWPLDEAWNATRVHAQIGDVITGLVPGCPLVSPIDEQTSQANSVGQEKVAMQCGGNVVLSVSRKEYVGFYEYRYMPEPEDA